MFDPGDLVTIKDEDDPLYGLVGEIVRVYPDRVSGFDYKVRIDVPFLKRGRFFLNHEELEACMP